MLRKRSVDTITENCMFVVTTFLFSTVFKRGLRVLQVEAEERPNKGEMSELRYITGFLHKTMD